MEKEFVPYEQALALKELGFDEPCIAYYENNGKNSLLVTDSVNFTNTDLKVEGISSPLYQQAFRWFREKHGYYVDLFVDDDKTFGFMISYFVEIGRADKPIQRKYNTYEEAELQCLKKLIEIVKSQKTSDESPHTKTFRTSASDYNSRGQYRK